MAQGSPENPDTQMMYTEYGTLNFDSWSQSTQRRVYTLYETPSWHSPL